MRWIGLIGVLAPLVLSACQSTSVAQTQRPEKIDASIEPVSGLPKNGLIAIQGLGKQYGIFYDQSKISNVQLKSAAPRVCKRVNATVESTKNAALAHPEQFPDGTQHFVIYCR